MNEDIEFDNLPTFGSDIGLELTDEELAGGFTAESEGATGSIVDFGAEVIKVAATYIGVSRDTNLPQIAKFLALFNLPTKQNNKWVPFCASGISYAACKTYCNLNKILYTADNSVSVFKSVIPAIKEKYFLPNASCGFIMQDAQRRGSWIDKKDMHISNIKPGYLVLYSWTGKDWPDHIGIVIKAEGMLHTLEFNTSSTNNINGGCVNWRTRSYNQVRGFVKI